jgi:dihydroflavonol-4-reductase
MARPDDARSFDTDQDVPPFNLCNLCGKVSAYFSAWERVSLKALVTGGTGFVGSHVVRALVEQGHSARVLHRKTSRLDALADVSFESALGDILDSDSLRAASEGCDWVFHVAAVADYWRADKQRMIDANVEGTRRVLDAARESGVKRVVFTSSAAAVGIRTDGRPADESIPFNLPPERFPYGYSKAMAEAVALEAVEGGQEVVIVNPVVVMGPGDLNVISGEFVLNIKRLGWLVPVTSGGVAVTDVRDVARWHVAAAQQGQVGQRYILGTENIAYPDWFRLIAEIVGAPRPRFRVLSALLPLIANLIDLLRSLGIHLPVDGNQTRLGAQNIFFDFSKTWNELGKPQIDMRQSVQDTYDWYTVHGYVK